MFIPPLIGVAYSILLLSTNPTAHTVFISIFTQASSAFRVRFVLAFLLARGCAFRGVKWFYNKEENPHCYQ